MTSLVHLSPTSLFALSRNFSFHESRQRSLSIFPPFTWIWLVSYYMLLPTPNSPFLTFVSVVVFVCCVDGLRRLLGAVFLPFASQLCAALPSLFQPFSFNFFLKISPKKCFKAEESLCVRRSWNNAATSWEQGRSCSDKGCVGWKSKEVVREVAKGVQMLGYPVSGVHWVTHIRTITFDFGFGI